MWRSPASTCGDARVVRFVAIVGSLVVAAVLITAAIGYFLNKLNRS